jgi:DNA/RNA-binding protein KIN17
MCSKQCRDQNGFKCHLTSESHQRQLLLFAENQNSYLRQFSSEFEAQFMHILRNTYGSKRVRANEVYQEYIKDKGHIHMNATVWHTLTGFLMYLGESGKCKIDQNEKGWHVQYIDQQEEIRKQKVKQKAKQEKDDEERMNDLLQRQIDRAMEIKKEEEEQTAPKELIRGEDDEKIKIELTKNVFIKKEEDGPKFGTSVLFSIPDRKPDIKKLKASTSKDHGHKRSALDELREEEERFKERKNRKDYWLFKGIVVKVMTKKLGSKFYKAKGEVIDVEDNYVGHIALFDEDKVVKIDQQDLETVIPAIGKDMLIVNGAYRGTKASLLEIMEDKYRVKLKIKEGLSNGRVVEIAYEDASKCA